MYGLGNEWMMNFYIMEREKKKAKVDSVQWQAFVIANGVGLEPMALAFTLKGTSTIFSLRYISFTFFFPISKTKYTTQPQFDSRMYAVCSFV